MATPIVIEKIFTAPINNLWSAITEKDLMKLWYFDLKEFIPEVGFVFEFMGGEEGGNQYLHRCEITEVVPEKKLVHTWIFVGYEGVSVLSFELFSLEEKTKLILTHAGIENFAEDNPDFARANFEAGWMHIINTSLNDFMNNHNF